MAKRSKRLRRPSRLKVHNANRLRLETLEPRQLLTTFYVDGGAGDDAADGQSLGTPFATIQAAANAAQAGDTVLIRGGVYREEVDVLRSGSSSAPIVFSAYQNEEVIVSGADSVTGWTPAPSIGPNVWQATVNWDAEGNRNGNTLFVNGELKHEARQFGENDPLDIDDWGLLRKGSLPSSATSFVVNDLGTFPNDHWNGAKIKLHRNDFAFEVKTITDFNSSTGRITFDSPVGITTQKQDNGYYIYDTIKALDKPGEWFKEAGSDTLYYQAEVGQDPNSLDIEFKRRGYGFDIDGRDHIHIQGITFRGASVETDGNSDNNLLAGNRFYAYDRANVGRFFLAGDNNVFRDNEFSHTWGSIVSVSGNRNALINNYIHNIGFDATTRAISAASATEFLFSHNTLQKYARSFMDGYAVRSEIAYNVFEDGGRLSWDTGVFDSDGGNGNSSYSIFHHNIFRDNNNARGIFEAFYGNNNNAVLHHNLFYDFGGSRPIVRAAGTEFRQLFHNTMITDLSSQPAGRLDARDAIGTRYNNNIQISVSRMEALGVDVRGNHNYTPSDFVNFGADDFRLAPGSGAIDSGIVVPGINDDFLGAAPDAGAFESGRPAWEAGHDFASPPNPTYAWFAVPGTNLYDNGQFLQGIDDWTVVAGTPNASDRNSWNLASSGASLTGSFRTRSIEFTPGEVLSRTFTGLTPNTTYTLGGEVRLANRLGDATGFVGSSGTIISGTHRGEGYVTGLTAGEWVEYRDVDFGDPDQYNQLDMLHIRDPSNFASSLDGVSVQVRLDSPTGPLLTEFTDLLDGVTGDRWRVNRAAFEGVSGERSIYVSVSGTNSSNLAIGSFRLLNDHLPPDDLLTVSVSSNGTATRLARFGTEDWEKGYENIIFTTGPSATEATVTFANTGRLNAYLDRIYLSAGSGTRGGEPRDLSTGALAYRSTGLTTGEFDSSLTDGSPETVALGGDHPGNWVHVDLGDKEAIHSIELTPPTEQPGRLSNFRVSVWSADPRSGGTVVWQQDYLTNGQALSADSVLQIQSDALSVDGETKLNAARGRFVRVESLGVNLIGNERIAVGDLRVTGFDSNNLSISDSTVTQSTTAPGGAAELALDNDPTTYSETLASGTNSFWQNRFSQSISIGQIELQNRDDSLFSDLSNFRVSVWDEEPENGGTQLWQKSYFSTGSVGRGETFVIDGSEVSDTSTRRLASVHTGRVVRVELIGPGGTNNNGNGRLSLAGVRVASSDTAPPIGNVAQRGIASQSSDFYGDANALGPAEGANDGVISTISNFTTANDGNGTWWQVELAQEEALEQIVVYNRTDAANRLNNFRVSAWDDDPDNGGTELWGRTNFYSSSAATYSTGTTIGPGGALIIDGSDTDSGTRLDAVDGVRFVRVELFSNNLLSLAEVQVWAGSNSIDLDPAETSFDFDFGTPQSVVQSGWQGVTPNTYGDVRWSRAVDSRDRSSGNNINRDFVTGEAPATLSVAVPNGVYDVTLNLGDADGTRDNLSIWAEGTLVADDLDFPAGQFSYVDENGVSATPRTFEVIVRDGEFNLRLDDAGDDPGALPGWLLNRMSLDRTGDIPAGPDNALQLLVDSDGGALLRNTTGASMSLAGYTISSGQNALVPGQWFGLGDQQYGGTDWSESSSSSGSLSESGAPITIPNGGQIYLGKLLDTSISQTATLQYQLEGEGTAEGYFASAALSIPRLVGDFNGDLRVDAADYTSWRDGFGSAAVAFSGSDANGDGQIDHSDRLFWQSRYGDEIAVSTLIDATNGNGSFEDWGPQDSLTRLLVNTGSRSIPGWTAVTNRNGGWIRQGDAAATVGASSDGIAYAIGTGGSTVEMTSDQLGHVTAEGEEFLIALDVGSKDGSENAYEVSLIFGGQERVVGTIIDGPNVTTEGMNRHELSYTAVAADAGLAPSLRITLSIAGSISQAFFDNVELRAAGGGAPATSEVALASLPAQSSTLAATPEEVDFETAESGGTANVDLAFLLADTGSTTTDGGTRSASTAATPAEYALSDTLLIDTDGWLKTADESVSEAAYDKTAENETEAWDAALLDFGQL